MCSEVGQLEFTEITSTVKDRTCYCDYRRGYNFAIQPRNIKSCIPSEEDCGCYIKKCPMGQMLDAGCTLVNCYKN